MRQVLGPGALERPRGMGWRGRWEGGSGWGTHVNPWLIHDNVWQKPLQYCKVISLQLIKINRKKRQNSQWFLGIINLKAVWYGMSFVYHLWLHIIFSRFIELLSNNWKLLFFYLILKQCWNSTQTTETVQQVISSFDVALCFKIRATINMKKTKKRTNKQKTSWVHIWGKSLRIGNLCITWVLLLLGWCPSLLIMIIETWH